jgi:NAD-dependent deacetylase
MGIERRRRPSRLAAGMVPLAARHGAPVVIVNAEPTPFDDLAVAVLRTPISAVLPALVAP